LHVFPHPTSTTIKRFSHGRHEETVNRNKVNAILNKKYQTRLVAVHFLKQVQA